MEIGDSIVFDRETWPLDGFLVMEKTISEIIDFIHDPMQKLESKCMVEVDGQKMGIYFSEVKQVIPRNTIERFDSKELEKGIAKDSFLTRAKNSFNNSRYAQLSKFEKLAEIQQYSWIGEERKDVASYLKALWLGDTRTIDYYESFGDCPGTIIGNKRLILRAKLFDLRVTGHNGYMQEPKLLKKEVIVLDKKNQIKLGCGKNGVYTYGINECTGNALGASPLSIWGEPFRNRETAIEAALNEFLEIFTAETVQDSCGNFNLAYCKKMAKITREKIKALSDDKEAQSNYKPESTNANVEPTQAQSKITVNPVKKPFVVTRELIDEMAEKLSSDTLSDGKARGVFHIGNSDYVATGLISSERQGIIQIWGNRVFPLDIYNGDLTPMTYSEHRIAVDEGRAERGYVGMTFTCNGVKWICLERVEFIPETPAVQLEMFEKPKKKRNYPGHKGRDGIFQTIVNEIPRFDFYHEIFAGSGAIARILQDADPQQLKTSVRNYRLNDLARDTYFDLVRNFPSNTVTNDCAISWFESFELAPGTKPFVFADPPYHHDTRRDSELYDCEMTVADHERFLNAAIKQTPQLRIAIIHPRCELYDTMLSGWRQKEITVRYHSKTQTEVLYMNYDEPLELHTTKFLGKDCWQRQQIKRKGDRWVNKLLGMPVLEKQYILDRISEITKKQ